MSLGGRKELGTADSIIQQTFREARYGERASAFETAIRKRTYFQRTETNRKDGWVAGSKFASCREKTSKNIGMLEKERVTLKLSEGVPTEGE